MNRNAPAPQKDHAARLAALLPRLAERERDHDLAGKLAADNLAGLRQAGLLALTVPAEHGGIGASLSETIETLRTIAQVSPSTALMLTMHTAILANYLLDPSHVPAEERDAFRAQRIWAWSEAIAGRIFAVANSEAGAGGDVHNSKATVSDGESEFTGVKTFASIGTGADYYMAAAWNAAGRVEYYLVRNDPAHVRVEAEWDAMGMRSSESVMLRFDRAPVVGVLGYRGMVDGVNLRHWSTLSFCAVFVGVAEGLLAEVVPQAGAMLQRTAAVEFHLAIQGARGFLRHLVESEPDVPDAAYRRLARDCKIFVTRTLAREGSALFAAQSGGAYRFTSPVGRKFRDLLAGPALRPPVGVSFDEIWKEMAK